jgi:Signal peptide peptidase
MLVGLFFYDIFWVFGTDVMVTVAKSFDGPIKVQRRHLLFKCSSVLVQ